MKSAGSVFRGGSTAASAAGGAGFAAGIASKFKPNSFVWDAVVEGGSQMGMGGGVGVVGRMFGGMAARNGVVLSGESISSVAARPGAVSGRIGGDIADRSLGNYMPHLRGTKLGGTDISGGRISTMAVGPDGKTANLEMYSASQFEKPAAPHSVVTAQDGSQWYQMATGDGMVSFYGTPSFSGDASEAAQVASTFPGAPEGTLLRSVDDGVIEASYPDGSNSTWYNSAFYDEPNAPHHTISTNDGVGWYTMDPHASPPQFEVGDTAQEYNHAQFSDYMPGYESYVSQVDASRLHDGIIEVRHEDGSGTRFYDYTQYEPPRGDYTVYAQAAQKAGQAIQKSGAQAGKEAAKQAATAGAEAASNAAAHAVNASVQVGTAVSEVAVGAALAAVWAMRHTIFKVIVSISLVLVFLITIVR